MGKPLTGLLRSEVNKPFGKILLLTDTPYYSNTTSPPSCWLHNTLCSWAELACKHVGSPVPHNQFSTFLINLLLYLFTPSLINSHTLLPHSFTLTISLHYSFTPSLIYSLTISLSQSFTPSFIYSITYHSLAISLSQLFTPSFIQSLMYFLHHSFTPILIPTLNISLPHSFTPSLIHSLSISLPNLFTPSPIYYFTPSIICRYFG